MDSLFDALGALFGNKFTSQWGEYDATHAWAGELGNLPAQALHRGIARLRQQVQDAARQNDEAWPPTPVAFAALCQPRPEDMGLPAVPDAWREVCNHAHHPAQHRWSHEAVRLAGAAVGWWELTHGGGESRASRLESRFRREYAALVNRVMAGEQLHARALLAHDGQLTLAELAERASREAAQHNAEAAGMPPRMNSEQGLRSLRAALGSR